MITINMNKAVEIRKDQLRAERAPLLDALDVQFQRALETGADTSSIVAEKQRLRDITADPRLTQAATPEDLLAVTL